MSAEASRMLALSSAISILSRRVIRCLLWFRCHGDHFDFHIGSSRQRGNLDCGTGRGILFKIRAVCFVYSLKVGEVGEKDRRFDDVVESHSLSSQEGCDVVENSPGLRSNIARNNFARLWVKRDLAAAKQESAGAHRLRVRADRRRRFAGENALFHVADCNWKSTGHNGMAGRPWELYELQSLRRLETVPALPSHIARAAP